MRRLEAENGGRRGWLEAVTEYSIESGFHYQVTAEGGSSLVRSKVLRAVLDGEREIIAEGETARSSLALANYAFQPNGVDDDGLANILLSPKREERVLVEGTMFLKPDGGDLVRLQGRLVRSVLLGEERSDRAVVQRIEGVVVPVTLESTARCASSAPPHCA